MTNFVVATLYNQFIEEYGEATKCMKSKKVCYNFIKLGSDLYEKVSVNGYQFICVGSWWMW